MPSFPRIFQRTANPAPAGQRPADPIAPPRRDGLLTALRNRVQRAGAAARRSAPSLNGCTRFLASIGESFRHRGRRAEPAAQPSVPRSHTYQHSLEPLSPAPVHIHGPSQPVVVHMPAEFLNRETMESLFQGGTGSDLFKAVHDFATKTYCDEPFAFLKALEAVAGNMTEDNAEALFQDHFKEGALKQVNLATSLINALKSDLDAATSDAQRVAAFDVVRHEAKMTVFQHPYANFKKYHAARL